MFYVNSNNSKSKIITNCIFYKKNHKIILKTDTYNRICSPNSLFKLNIGCKIYSINKENLLYLHLIHKQKKKYEDILLFCFNCIVYALYRRKHRGANFAVR